VFNVLPPDGLEEYTRWIDLIEFPADLQRIFIDPACFGEYRARLWFGSMWPIILLCMFTTTKVFWELFRQSSCGRSMLRFSAQEIGARRIGAAIRSGCQQALPFTLALTFLVVPSTSTRIFRTFLCDSFGYDDSTGEMRRYLQADMMLQCDDSGRYAETQGTAIAMLVLWPIGVPIMYSLLLAASRNAIIRDTPTPLSEATAFLSGDYIVDAYWWEPLEMCRKLVLTGWVLLIGEDAEQLRVLVALLASIFFLTLRLSFKPLRRCILTSTLC